MNTNETPVTFSEDYPEDRAFVFQDNDGKGYSLAYVHAVPPTTRQQLTLNVYLELVRNGYRAETSMDQAIADVNKLYAATEEAPK